MPNSTRSTKPTASISNKSQTCSINPKSRQTFCRPLKCYFQSRKHSVGRQSVIFICASIMSPVRVQFPIEASILSPVRVLFPIVTSILSAVRVLYLIEVSTLSAVRVLYPIAASTLSPVRVLYPIEVSILSAVRVLHPIEASTRRRSKICNDYRLSDKG